MNIFSRMFGDYKREQVRFLEKRAQEMHASHQLVKALLYAQRALTFYQELKDEPGLARIENLQGRIAVDRSEASSAIAHFQQAATIYRRIGDRDGEGVALGNLATAHNELGNFQQAITYLEQSLKIAQELNDKEGIRAAYLNLGNSYFRLGDYDQAITSYQQSLAQGDPSVPTLERGIALGSLGEIHHAMADYDTAETYFLQSLEIARAVGDRQGEAGILGGLSILSISRHEYPKARAFAEQGLEIAEKLQLLLNEEKLLGYLGTAAYEEANYTEALTYHQRRLKIAQYIKDALEEAQSWGSLGSVYSDLKEWEEAEKCMQQELKIARELQAPLPEAAALNNLGAMLFEQGNKREAAEAFLWEATQIWEKLQSSMGARDIQKVLFMDQQITYELLLQVLIEQEKVVEALELTERRRTRAFQELVNQQRATRGESTKPVASPTFAELQAIAQEQKVTCVSYAFLLKTMEKRETARNLERSELLIWVIQPTGTLTFRRIAFKPFLDTQPIKELQESLTSSQQSPAAQSRNSTIITSQPPIDSEILQSYYRLLIDPIIDLLPTNPSDHIVFIPQSELFQVPFAALQDTKGQYLIEKHIIRVAPSIQILYNSRMQHQQILLARKQGRLVVGISDAREIHLPDRRAWHLSELPYAKQEASEVAKIVATSVFPAEEATKQAIIKVLPEQDLIHLATHGLLEEVDGTGVPGAIVLQPSTEDNGLLPSMEILPIPLHAQLVVLSACNTGRGRLTGEGIFGLPRVLLAAGAASILVSLWAVPDQATSFLMEEFYHHLRSNSDSARALREAMLSTMQHAPDPTAWAAFLLMGEAEYQL